MDKKTTYQYDIAIVGGLGHVGLPLGIVFADKGLNVCLCDIDKKKADMVERGIMPFIEYGSEPILKKVIENKKLKISLDINEVSKAKYVIIAIGTPVDEYLNPKTRQFLEFFESIRGNLSKEQTIIIRSTVYPNTCRQILNSLGEGFNIAYCPERIVQGYSVKELRELPQIVAGLSEKAVEEAGKGGGGSKETEKVMDLQSKILGAVLKKDSKLVLGVIKELKISKNDIRSLLK